MNSTTNRTEQYLDDLARMLAGLDPEERADVLDGVRDHVESALGALGHEPTSADVDRVLAELGSPGDVAREALAGRAAAPAAVAPMAAPDRPALAGAWVPATAVGLIFLGAALGIFILPLAMLLAGLVLLWASPLWTPAEKVLGTILPVLGIGGVPVGSLLVVRVSEGSEGSAIAPLGYLLIAAAVAGLVTLVLLAIRGGRRANEWPA